MCHPTLSWQSERFATLSEVFVFCDDRQRDPPICPTTTTLTSECLGDLPVTTFNGRVSIQNLGHAADLLRHLFSKVRAEYICDGIRLREPYEIEPRLWKLIRKVFGLTHEPRGILSREQIDASSLSSNDPWALASDLSKELFLFDYRGPVCLGTEQHSLNYTDYVGAALRANVQRSSHWGFAAVAYRKKSSY